jgi:phytoene synthase
MSVSLAQSYDYCRRVARTRARNFYYSFLLLGKAEKDAMCAVYAFNRYCDDLSDGPDKARPEAFDEWRQDLDRALDGDPAGHPLWPAFRDSVARFSIPRQYFHEMIDGVRSDIEPRRIATFDELYGYCYKVASVVGLTVVRIFGFEDDRALELAEKCGVAFQLTNILRDVKEDYGLGRIYLPAEDLARFGVNPNHLAMTQGFRDLMQFEVRRARTYYAESRPLIAMVHPKNRPAMWALIEIYRRLLERIEQSGYDVLSRRIHLSFLEKLALLTRAALKKPGTARMFPGF